MARASKYETDVKPYLKDVKDAIEAGATVEEIADALSLHPSTIWAYKKKYPEFNELFARGRKIIIFKIKAALLKKSLGFEYNEEKTISRLGKKGETITSVERSKKYCPPSETAAAMLLRNYDDNWKDTDNATVTLRQREAELKKEIAKSEHWDINLGE